MFWCVYIDRTGSVGHAALIGCEHLTEYDNRAVMSGYVGCIGDRDYVDERGINLRIFCAHSADYRAMCNVADFINRHELTVRTNPFSSDEYVCCIGGNEYAGETEPEAVKRAVRAVMRLVG